MISCCLLDVTHLSPGISNIQPLLLNWITARTIYLPNMFNCRQNNSICSWTTVKADQFIAAIRLLAHAHPVVSLARKVMLTP